MPRRKKHNGQQAQGGARNGKFKSYKKCRTPGGERVKARRARR